jgi:diguanylate cyclase (GGDEF)-like protein
MMRVLIIDDEASLHDAYRHCLDSSAPSDKASSLDAMARSLFTDGSASETAAEQQIAFECCHVLQGLDGVARVQESLLSDTPFQVAFIDVRMPPGIDGKETARRIRALDPDVNLVIVSGYSDHNVTDIAIVAGPPDKIFYISKPFTASEVRQMAWALCRRWESDANQVELLRAKVIELAASEARAIHIANHDFLTSAPNRMAFQQKLRDRLLQRSGQFALVALDLDRFKHVNDTFGHGAGDDLLIKIFSALKAAAPKDGLIARLGGDEFGILFECEDRDFGFRHVQDMVRSCSQTFEIYGSHVQISASAGFLINCGDDEFGDALDHMRYADMALFAAKRRGRNQVVEFDKQMDESVKFRQQMVEGLAQALENGELRLVYQPIAERGSLEIVGFEALARWESPAYGPISPRVFVPIAEESGLINQIGDWTIRQALADCRNWPDQYVSINFSPKQFQQTDIGEKLRAHAAAAGVPPQRIQVEITETTIFDDTVRATAILQNLQDLGFRVALDDFGTGYSSLFNIKNFSLDCIKIDKSFIDQLGQDSSSTAIVSAVAQMAKALQLTIVAEGVETDMQCQALRLIGCSHMQGYLFGMPESAEYTIDLLDISRGLTRRDGSHG